MISPLVPSFHCSKNMVKPIHQILRTVQIFVHGVPAWVTFLFLAFHIDDCNTSMAVMSVIKGFDLLPPTYLFVVVG